MIRVVTPGRIIAFRTSGSVAWTYDLHSGYFNEAAALGIDGSAYVPVTVGGFNGVPRTTGVLAVSHAGNGRWFAPIPAMATPVIGGDGTVDVAGTSNGLEHGTPTVGALRPIGWVKWLKILPDGVPATSPAIAVGGRLHVNVRQRTSNASSHPYAFGAD